MRAATPSVAAELAVPVKDALLQEVDLLSERLSHAMESSLAHKRLQLNALQKRLTALSPAQRGERLRAALSKAQSRIEMLMRASLVKKRHRVEQALLRLRTSGPMETMKRGYAVVLHEGTLLKSVSPVHSGDRLTVMLADGSIETVAQTLKPKEGES